MTGENGFFGLFRATSRPSPRDAVIAGPVWPESGTTAMQGATSGSIGQDAAWHHVGQSSVACHGEIYNARDLCKQLGMPAEVPLPHILLAGWRRWSAGLLPRLDGVFALVLRDGDELLLYRDPSGMRNLYWHQGDEGQISYATQLGTLLDLPGVGRRLERSSLHEYLRFLDIAAPHTLFEGVRALEAGHLMRCDARGTALVAVPAPASAEDMQGSFDEAVDALAGLLQRSVDARLADSVKPAAFLSGGIDSSLICTLAARHRRDTTALTVGFEAAHYDEAPVAQRVAGHLGLAHRVLRFGHQDYLGALERMCQGLEQPMADPATPATLLAFEHCRSHFDMVLDGTGADDSVGMLPPRHVRLAVGYASALPAGVRRALTRVMRALPVLSGYAPIMDFEHPADMMIRWRGFTRPEIEQLCGEPVSFEHTQFYRTFARFPRGAHFERSTALMNAEPFDRLIQSMLVSGMRVRYPFFDRNTDCFIRQLRTEWRYPPEEPKRILRALLARYVPRDIWDVPKHSFAFPVQEFLAAENFALVRRYLHPGRWHKAGLLRADVVWRYAGQFMAGDQRLTFRVWALVVLGAWLEKHNELD